MATLRASAEPSASAADSVGDMILVHKFLDFAKDRNWQEVRDMICATNGLVNARVKDRWTALHHAAFYGNIDMVHELLRRGAAPDILNSFGESPALVAQDPAVKECLDRAIACRRGQAFASTPQSYTKNFKRSTHDSALIGDRHAYLSEGRPGLGNSEP